MSGLSSPLPPAGRELRAGGEAQHCPPGSWLGVLGGGQLGRMFCMAAQAMGYRVCVLDPMPDGPAGSVADRQIVAAYDDPQAIDALASLCAAVTTEFENVPAQSLERLAQRCIVRPAASAVSVAQDRIVEKAFLRSCGVPVGAFAAIATAAEGAAVAPELFPAICKTARLGYDGKGQIAVAAPQDLPQAWRALGGVPCVVEQRIDLRRELSVVLARGHDGAVAVFAVHENEHRGGILAVSIAPARIPAETADRAREIATQIAEGLQYTGVLCVELFERTDGTLLVNEIAPRPHNSGHATIDACINSQFDQQVRSLAGLPLGDPTAMRPSVMCNLLGDVWFGPDGAPRTPPFDAVLAIPGARLHLYGKTEARPGRKMGHVTVLGASVDEALARARLVAAILGLEEPR